MKKIHLMVCDLFLPADFAAEVCADLRLPALEKMLARGVLTGSAAASASSGGSGRAEERASLENYLYELFGVPCGADAPVAPISAAFDGLDEGCWLRADPVYLRLQRDQLVLLPEVEVSVGEAAQLCAALNEHFAGQGMEFFAPHPQRWYLRLDRLPDIETVPLSQAAGRNVRSLLPSGKEAAHWHRMFNEIQMLLHSHPANEDREARGALPLNSLWLWGGGCSFAEPLQKNYDSVSSDEPLAEMFAAAAGASFAGWPAQWRGEGNGDRQLLVWTGLRSALRGGDLAAWRTALQEFETAYAQPLWHALRAGKIAQLQVDVLGGDHVRRLSLTQVCTWAFWRRAKPLARYSMM
ncbi:hypothetical protein [Candidatus Ferrigenium straubiae]|uniref:hypothetical protein n=1 Tax=Candidatus Ferrigenium straubiae TaxID=2919506 RepID=UPI003F4AE4F9